ncbi:phosphatase [Peptoniphilus gorbachii]|uniref:Exopolyphosphatase/guanosine-5'-triphosphate, 3'-diphosphate pyrophosphatase n=1 Tax=Peptoniphilus gorbachii TaxID=411567 RepID=A0ABS2ML31_9FIRM|nr:phosphatase [Peptoniphilus gorbachii]MBM7550646.1 exopolyphosphatase/guanosine-5'-triphosphate,3'-diphosphate pyrophosphatase [Peptoniphilus gorbachii]
MRHAIVDIGSNTIRLIVFDINENKKNFKKVLNKKYTAGLITYVHDGELSGKGIKKLIKTLSSIKNIVIELNVDTFSPFATASLRNLENTEEVLEEVKKDLDIDIDVLEQVEEAFLGNVGIRSEIKVDSGISVDIGGASTEVVYFEEDGPREYINLKTGSLLLFGENVSRILPKKSEIRAIEKSVIRELNSSHFSSKENKLIGIGGTIRTTGKVIADLWNEDEKKFTLKDIYKLLNLIKDRNTETIRSIIRTNPARIHTIVPGIIILKILMEKFGIDEIEVSDNGLREGYLIYKVLEGNNEILFSK